MKKLLSVLLLSSIGLMANDIQVFTANSMHLTLDKGSKIKKLFFGTEEAYVKNSNAYKKAGGSIIDGFLSVGNSGGSGGAGASAGAIGVLITAAVIEGYNAIVADNHYILLSEAIDSQGNKTILKSLVISNDNIALEEAEKLAQADQNQLIGK